MIRKVISLKTKTITFIYTINTVTNKNQIKNDLPSIIGWDFNCYKWFDEKYFTHRPNDLYSYIGYESGEYNCSLYNQHYRYNGYAILDTDIEYPSIIEKRYLFKNGLCLEYLKDTVNGLYDY